MQCEPQPTAMPALHTLADVAEQERAKEIKSSVQKDPPRHMYGKIYYNFMKNEITELKGKTMEEHIELTLKSENAKKVTALFEDVLGGVLGIKNTPLEIKNIIKAFFIAQQDDAFNTNKALRTKEAAKEMKREFERTLHAMAVGKSNTDNCFEERYNHFKKEYIDFHKILAQEYALFTDIRNKGFRAGLKHFLPHEKEHEKFVAFVKKEISFMETSTALFNKGKRRPDTNYDRENNVAKRLCNVQKELPPEIEAYHTLIEGGFAYYPNGCNSMTDPVIALFTDTTERELWNELERHFSPGNKQPPVFKLLHFRVKSMMAQLYTIDRNNMGSYAKLLHLKTLEAQLESGTLDWDKYSDDLETFMQKILRRVPEGDRDDARRQWQLGHSIVLRKTTPAFRNYVLVQIFRFIDKYLHIIASSLRNRKLKESANPMLDHGMVRFLTLMNTESPADMPRTKAWLTESLRKQPAEIIEGIKKAHNLDFIEYVQRKAIFSLLLAKDLPTEESIPEILKLDLVRLRAAAASTMKNMLTHALQVTAANMPANNRLRRDPAFARHYVEQIHETMTLQRSLITNDIETIKASVAKNCTMTGNHTQENVHEFFDACSKMQALTAPCFAPDGTVVAMLQAIYFGREEELPPLRAKLLTCIAIAIESDATVIRKMAEVQLRVYSGIYAHILHEAVADMEA